MRKHEREPVEYAALSPAYWALGPFLGIMPILLMVAAFMVLGGSSASGDISWGLVALISALVVGAGALFYGSKVTLAEGGLWIKHYGAFKRFIPYSEISMVDLTQRLGKVAKGKFDTTNKFIIFHAVRLTLKSNERVIIGTASEETDDLSGKTTFSIGEEGHFGGSNPTARLLAGDIRNRVRLEENLPAPSPAAAALMRGDRSVADWRVALGQSVAEGGDAYRGDAATETLWRVVEDESAPRDARAGAAIALRRQLDDDGRARLRVVAEDCEPKLRVALDAALDEAIEEDKVLAALERASDRTD